MVVCRRMGIFLTVIILSAALAGCATHAARPVVGHKTTASTQPVGTAGASGSTSSPFPGIVNRAMRNFPSQVLDSPKAPTVLPFAGPGTGSFSFRTWDITTGPILSYSVQFVSSQGRLADFSGSTYSTIPASGAIWLPGDLTQGGHMTVATVDLAAGIFARRQSFEAPQGSAKEESFSSLSWREGRWQIKVINNQSTSAPVDEANMVAAYLHEHYLPVPQDRGAIFVDVMPEVSANGELTKLKDVSVYVKWQEGSHVYEVDTYKDCPDPVSTALAMVISMKPYPH